MFWNGEPHSFRTHFTPRRSNRKLITRRSPKNRWQACDRCDRPSATWLTQVGPRFSARPSDADRVPAVLWFRSDTCLQNEGWLAVNLPGTGELRRSGRAVHCAGMVFNVSSCDLLCEDSPGTLAHDVLCQGYSRKWQIGIGKRARTARKHLEKPVLPIPIWADLMKLDVGNCATLSTFLE